MRMATGVHTSVYLWICGIDIGIAEKATRGYRRQGRYSYTYANTPILRLNDLDMPS